TIAYVDAESWPSMADPTGGGIYARLQRGDDAIPTAYKPEDLDAWAARAKLWAAGANPTDLPLIDVAPSTETKSCDVFIYFIHEGKLRAPAAAMALIDRLDAKRTF